jgi:hypothetical protein
MNPIVAGFASHMRSLCICEDVSLINVPAYTQPVYMQGTAKLINNDQIYKAFCHRMGHQLSYRALAAALWLEEVENGREERGNS